MRVVDRLAAGKCSAARRTFQNADLTLEGHLFPPLPLAMVSQADEPAPAATVDNGAALAVNGSADGAVVANGVTAPSAHDHADSAGMVEYTTCSLGSSNNGFKRCNLPR